MGFGSPDHLHLLVEAKKLAFEDRARFYADPAFAKIPVAELISTDYADKRRALIDPGAAPRTSVDAGNPALDHGDTIYLTTADNDRNMVSLIQSNFRGFGSGLSPARPGLLPPEPRRAVRPHDRPPQQLRARQAAVPHHHPRLGHQGRQARD